MHKWFSSSGTMSPSGKYGTSLRCDTSPEATSDAVHSLWSGKKKLLSQLLLVRKQTLFYYWSNFCRCENKPYLWAFLFEQTKLLCSLMEEYIHVLFYLSLLHDEKKTLVLSALLPAICCSGFPLYIHLSATWMGLRQVADIWSIQYLLIALTAYSWTQGMC